MFEVERLVDGETHVLSVPRPALLTCLKEANHPRIPTLKGCISAFRTKPLFTWNAEQVNAPLEKMGLNGSPTQVRRTFTPEPKGDGVLIEGEPADSVRALITMLKEKGVL